MPVIDFSIISGRPKVDLMPSDYFYSPSSPDAPSVDTPARGALKEAQDKVAEYLPDLQDISRVLTNVDISGCAIGWQFANQSQASNRAGEDTRTLEDICVDLMDDPQYGFLKMFNDHVEIFAEALYVRSGSMFAPGSLDSREYLNGTYTMLKRSLNGQIRGYNAIFACAQVNAWTSSDLDAPPFNKIERPGKIPADFAR